jgi:hypothetical protein
MPSTGWLSHAFETRVQRDLHPLPVSQGNLSHKHQSGGPLQGSIFGPLHAAAARADIRETAQPFMADISKVRIFILNEI